jgi:hypothetical protein
MHSVNEQGSGGTGDLFLRIFRGMTRFSSERRGFPAVT